METNVSIVLVGAVVSMIVGSIWYGPLFGKKWMEICGVGSMDEAKRKQMQKEALPLYGAQFLLSLLQVYILMNLIAWTGGPGMGVAFFMWLGFVMPTVAASAMWNNDTSSIKWARFLIQAGFQLVLFLIYGYGIGMWG
jgi:Protein of unknown function (DUF1761)